MLLLSVQIYPIYVDSSEPNERELNNSQGIGPSISLTKDNIISQTRTYYIFNDFSNVTYFLQVSGGREYSVTNFPSLWSFDHVSPVPDTSSVDANGCINFTGKPETPYTVYWIADDSYQPVGWKDDSFLNTGWHAERGSDASLISSSFVSDGDILTLTVSGIPSGYRNYRTLIPSVKPSEYRFLVFRAMGTENARWVIILQDTDQHDILYVGGGWQKFSSTMTTYSYDVSSLTEEIAYVSVGIESLDGSIQSGHFDYLMLSKSYPQPFFAKLGSNGGFETGNTDNWTIVEGDASVVSDIVYEGKYALRLSASEAQVGPFVNVSRTNGMEAACERTFRRSDRSNDESFELNLTGHTNYEVSGYPNNWSFESLIRNGEKTSLDNGSNVNYFIAKSGLDSNDTIEIVWRSCELYDPVGWKDDSFLNGWSVFSGIPTTYQTDGNVVTWTVPKGQGDAYIERGDLNIDLDRNPFLLVRYMHSTGVLSLSLDRNGVSLRTIFLPVSTDFTTYVFDTRTMREKSFNQISVHAYGEDTVTYVDFIMVGSMHIAPLARVIHPSSYAWGGHFSVYVASGSAAGLIIQSENKSLYYLFYSSDSFNAEAVNGTVAVTIATKDRWCSLYVDVNENWLNAFGTVLPDTWNLTLAAMSKNPVYFDDFDFWTRTLTVTVYGSLFQPLVGANVRLLEPNGTVIDETTSNYDGAAVFYVGDETYLVELQYRYMSVMKTINIHLSSFYVISLDVFVEVAGIPLTRMQTAELIGTVGASLTLVAIISFKTRKRRKNNHMMIPENYPGSLQLVRQLCKTLEIKSGALLLDCGCGDAFISHLIMELSGVTVVGIDVESKKLRRFGSRDISKCVADARYMPFKDGCFDYAVCINVLEHVRESGSVIQEIARATNKNSKIYLSVPNSYSDTAFFLQGIMRRLDIVAGHVRHFRLADLIHLLGNADFYCYNYQYASFLLGWPVAFFIVRRNRLAGPSNQRITLSRLLLNGYIEVYARFEQQLFEKFRHCAQVSVYAQKK